MISVSSPYFDRMVLLASAGVLVMTDLVIIFPSISNLARKHFAPHLM